MKQLLNEIHIYTLLTGKYSVELLTYKSLPEMAESSCKSKAITCCDLCMKKLSFCKVSNNRLNICKFSVPLPITATQQN